MKATEHLGKLRKPAAALRVPEYPPARPGRPGRPCRPRWKPRGLSFSSSLEGSFASSRAPKGVDRPRQRPYMGQDMLKAAILPPRLSDGLHIPGQGLFYNFEGIDLLVNTDPPNFPRFESIALSLPMDSINCTPASAKRRNCSSSGPSLTRISAF